MRNRQSFKLNQEDKNKTYHVHQYIHHNTKKSSNIYIFYILRLFIYFILFPNFYFIMLQKVSTHLDEHCRANFLYQGLEGRTCVMFLNGLHSKKLKICNLDKCKDSKYTKMVPSK